MGQSSGALFAKRGQKINVNSEDLGSGPGKTGPKSVKNRVKKTSQTTPFLTHFLSGSDPKSSLFTLYKRPKWVKKWSKKWPHFWTRNRWFTMPDEAKRPFLGVPEIGFSEVLVFIKRYIHRFWKKVGQKRGQKSVHFFSKNGQNDRFWPLFGPFLGSFLDHFWGHFDQYINDFGLRKWSKNGSKNGVIFGPQKMAIFGQFGPKWPKIAVSDVQDLGFFGFFHYFGQFRPLWPEGSNIYSVGSMYWPK